MHSQHCCQARTAAATCCTSSRTMRLAACTWHGPYAVTFPGQVNRACQPGVPCGTSLQACAGCPHGCHSGLWGLSCLVACSRGELSTRCSLLCQGMWFVGCLDPLKRFFWPSQPCWGGSLGSLAAARSGEMAGVTCSPPCSDALQAEVGLWAALGLPGEMT